MAKNILGDTKKKFWYQGPEPLWSTEFHKHPSYFSQEEEHRSQHKNNKKQMMNYRNFYFSSKNYEMGCETRARLEHLKYLFPFWV